jgi:DNA-binding response OmpR family regulator
MIAEDDLLVADMLEDTPIDRGYDVRGIARTVESAVELDERHKLDLAILDLRLADGGFGTEIAARLKRRVALCKSQATAKHAISHFRLQCRASHAPHRA